MNLIETSHGTVCARCLLWPDLCNCDGKSEIIEALVGLFGMKTCPTGGDSK